LVVNQPAFCESEEDQFKVWPTNRDRSAFNDVMSAETPVKYDAMSNRDARLVKAHRFFAEQARRGYRNADQRKFLRERTSSNMPCATSCNSS